MTAANTTDPFRSADPDRSSPIPESSRPAPASGTGNADNEPAIDTAVPASANCRCDLTPPPDLSIKRSVVGGESVVMRETTDSDWTQALPVGNVTSVTLSISKDNVQFGIRAVDSNRNLSPVAFPQAVA